MLNKIFYRHYVFLEQINNLIEKNILKFNNISMADSILAGGEGFKTYQQNLNLLR